MPVIRDTVGPPDVSQFQPLWVELAGELTSPKQYGQPMVRVESFPRTGLDGVTVIWDKFDGLGDRDRAGVILKAFETAYGLATRERIGFAVGMTVPEAIEVEALPYRVEPALKPTDSPEWPDQVIRAMRDAGASTLRRSDWPILRFQTKEQAIACRDHLISLVPGTEKVWMIVYDGSANPFARSD